MKTLITGGTGLVGTRLTSLLTQKGYELSLLSRHAPKDTTCRFFEWDYKNDHLEKGALENVDSIIHLAGAGVADQKWSAERKTEILESRTQTSRLLFDQLSKGGHCVKTLVTASAIGIYGQDTGRTTVKESDAKGAGFLAHVTSAWETSTGRFEEIGIRVVQLRIGVVLSNKGGALSKVLAPPVMAPLGKGNQYISWIHIDDLCGIIQKALEDEKMQGPYNAVAPNPVTNKELTRSAAKVFGKPFTPVPVPRLVLKLLLGEMASIVLGGNRVSSQKVREAGYRFKFPELEHALKNLKPD